MRAVVNEPRGTGYASRSESVSISGKTGSAQSGTGGGDHAWFIAYVPSDAPSLAMGILVEHALHGATAAAPIAKAVAEVVFNKNEEEAKPAQQVLLNKPEKDVKPAQQAMPNNPKKEVKPGQINVHR